MRIYITSHLGWNFQLPLTLFLPLAHELIWLSCACFKNNYNSHITASICHSQLPSLTQLPFLRKTRRTLAIFKKNTRVPLPEERIEMVEKVDRQASQEGTAQSGQEYWVVRTVPIKLRQRKTLTLESSQDRLWPPKTAHPVLLREPYCEME